MAKPADDEDERRIISEFTHLLEKSKQLFNGLRDLPQYGHKQWQSYFGRTFDVYTRLWKFQQQHRQTLDVAYGLKRWQIGEVASKIGQLYYHYYLRTSETSYLEEAYAFYLAIRGRGYYAKAGRDGGPELVVKKLRYLARFIVVCLLLRRLKLVRELVRELAKHIDEYVATYRPADELEWNMVLDEIRTFVEADSTVRVVDIDHADLPGAVSSVEPVTFCHRLGPHNAPPLERTTPSALELAEAVIVGNCGEQVKFSELTIDMYRLLQTLEREPSPTSVNPADGHHPLLANGSSATGPLSTSSGHNSLPPALPHQNSLVHSPLQLDANTANSGLPTQSVCRNPHKYLLYKPTFAQLFAFLSAAFKDLPPNGVLLVYLSADASRPPPPGGSAAPGTNLMPIRQRSEDLTYELGGVATNSRRETADANANANAGANAWRANAAAKRGTFVKEAHCVHPGDLLPFTRKPLLLIVDSENSGAFASLPSLFGQPVICLMSPEVLPSAFAEQRARGSLFSLFLHSPLLAFCAVCAQTSLTLASCDRLQAVIDKFLAEAGRVLVRSRALDFAFIQFYADDFLRCLLLRFIFSCLVLRLHKGFKGSRCHPSSCPAVPEGEVLAQPVLHRLILDLASLIDVRHLFLELNERD